MALAVGRRCSLCTPSTWGSGHGHCSGGSRGHWGSTRPGCLRAGPLSLTEVAAGLLSIGFIKVGFWAKGDDKLWLGEWELPPELRGCSVQADPQGSGCCCSMGLADLSSIPKITLHLCRMVQRVPVAFLRDLPASLEYTAQTIGVWFVLWIIHCKAPVFPTCWRGCWLISSPGWPGHGGVSEMSLSIWCLSQDSCSMEQRAAWECCQLHSLLPALFSCFSECKGSASTSKNAKVLLLFDQDSPGHLPGMSAWENSKPTGPSQWNGEALWITGGF